MARPAQNPAPGSRLLCRRGDVLEVVLTLPAPAAGHAWLRTNVGRAAVARRAVAEHVDSGRPPLALDWHDIPMRRVDDRRFRAAAPLHEVGRFEAKAFFRADGADRLAWPEGDNLRVKVEPAFDAAANSVYTAFVRLMGARRAGAGQPPVEEALLRGLEDAGYEVIPRSGTFRDLIRRLDFIIGTLRFRIVQLLPIHPVPTTYARMGRLGSPFAALDFTEVDPALAEFDRKTTPMDQFIELVDAVHARGARLFMDMPVNHTGWASRMQIAHPEWFLRNGDSSFRSPGAWGVTWEDLSQLDYAHRDLWQSMARTFLLWCERGVDGFRCDAGYMVPQAAWEYIVASVRRQYPDTIFLLEGLGGRLETTRALLGEAGLDWAYSELFQSLSRADIERCLAVADAVCAADGTLIHFAETHDNRRLAARSRDFARMRTALAALLARNGAFGMTTGVEWFATEKIDVHCLTSLNWDSAENQVHHIRRLNAVLEAHPAFHAGAALRLIHNSPDEALAARRVSAEGGRAVLVLANLRDDATQTAAWPRREFDAAGRRLTDLLGGAAPLVEDRGADLACRLEPGQVLCLSTEPADAERIESVLRTPASVPAPCRAQTARAKAMEIRLFFRPDALEATADPDRDAADLACDPAGFCRRAAAALTPAGPADAARDEAAASGRAAPARPPSAHAPVTVWRWPRDARRRVVLPPGHCLLVRSSVPFAAALRDAARAYRRESSLPCDDGTHFAALLPPSAEEFSGPDLRLDMEAFENGGCRRASGPLLMPPASREVRVRTSFTREEVIAGDLYALATNGLGGMAQVRGAWGQIRSQYDALLAANLDAAAPADRRVMLARCRGWLVRDEYSEELGPHCLDAFAHAPGGETRWRFTVPAGRGRVVRLRVCLSMPALRNAVALRFVREKAGNAPEALDDGVPVSLILRPDVEDRINHERTRAFAGPERDWPRATAHDPGGFVFAPSADRRLHVRLAPGAFAWEPQWVYGIALPAEADRGQDGTSDLFSPGYFRVALRGGEEATLLAEVGRESLAPPLAPGNGESPRGGCAPISPAPGENAGASPPSPLGGHTLSSPPSPLGGEGRGEGFLAGAGLAAMRQFLVRRGDAITVIAGYPWFLDWGRDTLICLRGLIAAGLLREARAVLTQFARFERDGTLPNMLRGADDSNRDTSDAPLWFCVACDELMAREGSAAFAAQDCGGRSLAAVLRSIGDSYLRGTPNGIRVDARSALVFSPCHFTWMDTNHPAGTPREGYPVEIQALWRRALGTLSRLDPDGPWADLAAKVKRSVMDMFIVDGRIRDAESEARNDLYLSDCLHGPPGTPAAAAETDDALRPNQLLAVTLGLVDDPDVCAGILAATEELLVPGAIRSLADRPVRRALPIVHDGRPLNDPRKPYWGAYRGEEDTRRKPAYHNGTAWTWLFPSYAEALVMTCGDAARGAALALLAGSEALINSGCVGQVPEIVDGDAPHAPRGCGAQAWGVTELYRVLAFLAPKA